MLLYDVNCLVGHWAFARLRHESFPELLKLHHAGGVIGGLVSCLDSIFYNDPSVGDEAFFRIAAGSPYIPVMTVNPQIPCWERDIDRFAPRAVRVYPTFHGYPLDDPELARLADCLAERRIPLLLTGWMLHPRETYLFHPAPADAAGTASFLRAHPALTTLLLGYNAPELNHADLRAAILERDNVCFDIAFEHYMDPAVFVSTYGAMRMLYGSLTPLLCLESTRLTLEKIDIAESEREAIACGNFRRLFAI